MSLIRFNSCRTIFFLDEPHPSPGAPWTRISSFANAAIANGFQADVIGIFSPKALGQRGFKRIANVNVFNVIFKIPLPNPLLFVFNFSWSLVASIFVLVLRRPRIAIVSFPGGDSASGFLVACELLRIKIVIDYRDEWENQLICSPTIPELSKRFYRFAKKIWPSLFYRAES